MAKNEPDPRFEGLTEDEIGQLMVAVGNEGNPKEPSDVEFVRACANEISRRRKASGESQ